MIVTIIGARPQFIKAAAVSLAFRRAGIEEWILHTGQHYDEEMSEVFWKELGMMPWRVNLKVGSGLHGKQTAQMIEKIESFILDHAQDIDGVLLYGDTNSTLAGAIAASKLQVPIIHVEAGLRSFNREMPEEINRIVTDHLSEVLFCSSDEGKLQLEREGIQKNVYTVGDVMYDAFLQFSKKAQQEIPIRQLLPNITESFSLLTVHRPANTDNLNNLNSILHAIREINEIIVWPVHPRVKNQLEAIDLPPNLKLLRPLSYFEMLVALHNCHKVLTDSGGLQKEAYWAKKACITLREETEWKETLSHQWNQTTGADNVKIINAYYQTVDPSSWIPLYGDGQASDKIAVIIKEKFAVSVPV